MFARVSDLEAAAQQHQAIVKDLETRLHKSESELTRAMRVTDNDQADSEEKSNELNGLINQLMKDRDDALRKVGCLTTRVKEARLKADRCSAEWFKAWQKSDEFLAYNTEVGERTYQSWRGNCAGSNEEGYKPRLEIH